MEAHPAIETPDLLERLRAENWSPGTFSEWLSGDLSQIEARRELARVLQSRLCEDGERDHFAFGAAAFVLGRFDDACRHLDQAEDSDASHFLRGMALTRLSRGQDAIAHIRAALKRYPERKELQVAEIEALVQSGDCEAAEEKLAVFEKTHPGAIETEYLRGYLLEHSGRLGDAIDVYHAILAKQPDHAPTLFRLGFALDLCGEDDEAIRTYERLRDTQPTYPNAICNLGVLYEDREEYDKAVRCYRWVLDADPYNRKARLFLRDAESSMDMYYDEEQERLEDKFNQILRTPITDFELSVRSRNCLAKMQIETLGDLVQKTEAELLSYKNFGETSLAEIKDILASKGLHLGMSLGMDEDARQIREKAISIIFGLQKKAPPGRVPLGGTAGPASPPVDGDPEVYSKPVGDIAFSMRIKRALAHLNINTLGDLAQRSEAEFLSIKNFGQTSMEELRKKASEFGITIRKG